MSKHQSQTTTVVLGILLARTIQFCQEAKLVIYQATVLHHESHKVGVLLVFRRSHLGCVLCTGSKKIRKNTELERVEENVNMAAVTS